MRWKDEEMQRALLLGLVPFLGIKLFYYWNQLAGFYPLVIGFILFIFIVAIVYFLVVSIWQLVKNRKSATTKAAYPVILYLFFLVFTFYDPFELNAEAFQARPIITARYRGTQNFATLKIRDNGRFDYEGSGAFAYSFFFKGSWSQVADTLFLTCDNGDSLAIGNKLVIDSPNKVMYSISENGTIGRAGLVIK